MYKGEQYGYSAFSRQYMGHMWCGSEGVLRQALQPETGAGEGGVTGCAGAMQ